MELIRTNIECTVTLLEACRNYGGIKRFVYISTDEVYGDTTESKNGDACQHPTNPYSASKISAEHFVDVYRLSYNIPSVIVRMCNIYGPKQSLDKVVPKFIMAPMNEKPFTIQGDVKQKGSWLFVKDACRAIYIHKGEKGEIYNIGTSFKISVLELAEKILRNVDSVQARPKGELKIEYIIDRPYNDRRYELDPSKLMSKLGWEPSVDFDEGMRETVTSYVKNI